MSMSANPPSRSRARADLMRIYAAAVAAVAPHRVIAQALSGVTPGAGSVPAILARANGVRLLAVGKAALGMAAEAEHRIGDRLIEGLVIAPAGSDADTANSALIAGGAIAPVGGAGNSGAAALRSRAMLAAHPLPDESSVTAAHAALELARRATPGELVILALSGGASALIAAPSGGVTLADKIAISGALMRAGANIRELNTVRKHLSRIKGGRLARAGKRAEIVTLAISDVPHDDPTAIASGPTVGDPTTLTEARAIVAKYRLDVDDAIRRALDDPGNESCKPGDDAFARARFELIARPRASLDAAIELAKNAGYRIIDLGADLEGEARSVAADHAQLALEARGQGGRVAILSGGELTVTVRGHGRGGPNQEYALALAGLLRDITGIAALAADTDGADGGAGSATDPAGAIIDFRTFAKMKSLGLDANAYLDNNDATAFFEQTGDLLITGPTLTNVNDIRVILVE